jgi:hypothetical protein
VMSVTGRPSSSSSSCNRLLSLLLTERRIPFKVRNRTFATQFLRGVSCSLHSKLDRPAAPRALGRETPSGIAGKKRKGKEEKEEERD